jgi:TolB-like protein/Flp pilus assembly protein TadD
MSDKPSFFAELKRRNVYKVAVAYAIVGWLLIQIATQVFPFLEIPIWVVRLVIALVAIGFPIALVIAWAFELTPEGIKRTEDVDPFDSHSGQVLEAAAQRPRHRAWIFVVIIAGAMSVALFFLGRYSATNKAEQTDRVAGKSIAVLPFANLSRDPDNEYFADGIQDEIITRLSQVAELKVISGTSTRRYKGTGQNLSQIARELGVAHILEGSVQKSGDQVHVNVQLINALTDAHLWADIYDRKLTDIFAVESEIAKTIAETLRVKLTGAQAKAITARPTENDAAHELYLKGRYFWFKRTAEDLKKAAAYFQQAIDADPNYALAYVGLADAFVLVPAYGGASPQDCYPRTKAAARRAIELDDNLAEAHASYGKVLWNHDFDFAQSLLEFERALKLNPNYATAHHWYGNSPLASLGRFDQAIAEMKRAVELDPLSLIYNADFGATLVLARRYDEAIERLQRTLELDPNFYYAHYNLGLALELKGDLNAAIAEYKKARELNDDPVPAAYLGHAYAVAGRKDDALQILSELAEQAKHRYVPNPAFALVELGLGNKEKALDWLEKGYEAHEARFIAYIKVDPFLDPLRGDPRFEALVQKVFARKP